MRSVTGLCLTLFIFTNASAFESGLIVSGELAWSDTNNAIELPLNNPQLPAWNQAFDDSNLAWGASVGWQITRHISIQFGYMDMGEFSADKSAAINAPRVGLDVNEFSLSTKFRFPLSEELDATWWLGMSRAEFDADGTLQFPVLIARLEPPELPDDYYFNPFPGSGSGSSRFSYPLTDPGFVFPTAEHEFDDPDDEVGFLWGFGIDWSLTEDFSVTAKYLRHNVRLMEIDTFNLGVMYSL